MDRAEQGPDARFPVSTGSTHGGAILRPTPRVFPNLASVVDGVFAEADPTYLTAVPTMVALSDSGGVRYAVPAMPRLAADRQRGLGRSWPPARAR